MSYHPSGSKRIEGKDLLYFDQNYKEEHMEVYISFVNAEGTQVSDSVYAGAFEAVAQEPQEIETENQQRIEEKTAVESSHTIIAKLPENRVEPVIPKLKITPKRNRLWFLEALKNRTAPS